MPVTSEEGSAVLRSMKEMCTTSDHGVRSKPTSSRVRSSPER